MQKLFLVSIIISSLSACKKENTSPQQLIIGKWTMLSASADTFKNNTLTGSGTEQFEASDFAEFRSDGSVTSVSHRTRMTNNYSVLGDTLFFDSGGKAKIKTLTKNTLTYYFTKVINTSYWIINTFYIKK